MNSENRVLQLRRRVLKLLTIDGISVNDVSKATGIPRYTIWQWQLEEDDRQVVRLAEYIPDTDHDLSKIYDSKGERHAPQTFKW